MCGSSSACFIFKMDCIWIDFIQVNKIILIISSESNFFVWVKRSYDIDIDIFVASAGFDQGYEDWGNLLYPEDYTVLGRLMKEYSEKLCSGRRYALLEGGYNHDVLGINVDAFCEGFR